MMKIFVLIAGLLFASTLLADEFVIHNASLLNPGEEDVVGQTSIYVKDGLIVEVGREVSGSTAAEIIDAEGATVTPGFFDSGTHLGLAEVGSLSRSNDYRLKEGDLGAGFPVGLAINRFSTFIPMIRMEGVTRALVTPSAGVEVFAGQSAIMHLGDSAGFLIDESNAVFVYLGEYGSRYSEGSRAKGLLDVIASLQQAELYRDNKRAYNTRKLKELGQSELDLQALVPVVDGDKPLALYVDRAAEIESAIRNLGEFDIELVLVGAREAWKVKETIAAENIPVVLNPIDNLPSSFDQIGARLDNAAILTDAGITVAYMTEDLYTESRLLSQGAGVSVAHGMSRGQALAAITTNPAKIWGLSDRYGSIEAGNEADIIIWDGDPLEVTSAPTHVMIRGAMVDMKSRQTLLRDRYK